MLTSYADNPIRLRPTNAVGAFLGQEKRERLPGTLGNGDYFVLPVTSTGTLTYYNAAGTLQFTVAHTDIAAAADHWIGIVGGWANTVLLAAWNAPDEIRIARLNVSNGTVSSKQTIVLPTGWTSNPTWPTSSISYAAPDTLTIHSTVGEYAEVDHGGAGLITDVSLYHPALTSKYVYRARDTSVGPVVAGDLVCGAWTVGADGVSPVITALGSVSTGREATYITLPADAGPVATTAINPIRLLIDGVAYVGLGYGTAATLNRGGRLFTEVAFNALLARLATRYGVI